MTDYTGNILIIDDNPEICEILGVLLRKEGFRVQEVQDCSKALAFFSNPIDLIILDVMMPKHSGFEICEKIREITTAPILFLTAKAADKDKEMGFSCGGDDYLVKPFSSSELIARVKALLRRYFIYQGGKKHTSTESIHIRDLCVDFSKKTVWILGKEINLTDKEYKILKLLLQNPSRILSSEEIYESVWNEAFLPSSSNTVMVHVKNLRRKIELDYQNPKYIRTVWGKGYEIG
ncbi:transcriptional regulatory protein [Clostridium aceticum]|uniref:Stage 0 sporulation protein A homolog n=2 Tax=Clostridium aceticum TaxID=84022 RepID=A0A0D8IAH0_9CLOT|nr:response regulator transcription factor [Clostridium aceticum]AKL96556.1 transcriptional regulatory protein [Clostridium aceticum]KJF27285.1 PhoB family transcriptional regulator [Clostridium aceticum]